MNAALQIAQLNYDRVLPPEDYEARETAAAEWLAESCEQIVRHRADIRFKRIGHPEQGVTHAKYLVALQDHLNQQQIDGNDKHDWLAQLVLNNAYGYASPTIAGYLIGTGHPMGKLFEIAEALLRPLVDDALTAKAEDEAL